MKYKISAYDKETYSGQKYTRYHVSIVDGGIRSEASNTDPASAVMDAVQAFIYKALANVPPRHEARINGAARFLGFEIGQEQAKWVGPSSNKWWGRSCTIDKVDGEWYFWPLALKSFSGKPYRLATVHKVLAFRRSDFSPNKWGRVIAAARRMEPGQTVEL